MSLQFVTGAKESVEIEEVNYTDLESVGKFVHGLQAQIHFTGLNSLVISTLESMRHHVFLRETLLLSHVSRLSAHQL
jgi:hypothetical protein